MQLLIGSDAVALPGLVSPLLGYRRVAGIGAM